MFFALFFAALLVIMSVVTIRRQADRLKLLRLPQSMASDDRSYLRNQAWRRIAIGVLSLGLAGLLSGTYLLGLEARADQIADRPPAAEGDPERPPPDRQFLRFYSLYWIATLCVIFVIISLAIVDLWSTRRYGWSQLRRIQSEHRTILERDLAMYRQQRLNERGSAGLR